MKQLSMVLKSEIRKDKLIEFVKEYRMRSNFIA